MSRRFIRWAAAAALAVIFPCFCWLASSRLICPPRRQLQSYHREIIDDPHGHGLRIEPFVLRSTIHKDTPCLLCEPIADPSRAEKGAKLRSQLTDEGIALKPWGEIQGTLVLLHGHTGCKEDHLPVAERFCAAGFRCLLIDLPGHGQNPRPFASFGKDENGLPLEVLQEASRRFTFKAHPAAIFGISQGGAIALQAAARNPEMWFAVAELSSFAELQSVIANQAERLFGPLHLPAEAAVTRLVRWRAGFHPSEIRPVDSAKKLSSIPVLIGHGDADTFVPFDHGRRIFESTPSTAKNFMTIHKATHHTILITPQPVYATLSSFFLKALDNLPAFVE